MNEIKAYKNIIEPRLYAIFLHNLGPDPSIYCSNDTRLWMPMAYLQHPFFRKTRSPLTKVWFQFVNVYHLKTPSNLEMPKNWKERGLENMPDVEKYPIWGLWWERRGDLQYAVVHYRGSTRLFLTINLITWTWSHLWGGEWYRNIVVDLQLLLSSLWINSLQKVFD